MSSRHIVAALIFVVLACGTFALSFYRPSNSTDRSSTKDTQKANFHEEVVGPLRPVHEFEILGLRIGDKLETLRKVHPLAECYHDIFWLDEPEYKGIECKVEKIELGTGLFEIDPKRNEIYKIEVLKRTDLDEAEVLVAETVRSYGQPHRKFQVANQNGRTYGWIYGPCEFYYEVIGNSTFYGARHRTSSDPCLVVSRKQSLGEKIWEVVVELRKSSPPLHENSVSRFPGYGRQDLDKIRRAPFDNRIAFDRQYRGKRFTASGVFKRIDSLSLLGGYFAIVDIGDHSVLCKLNFDRLDYLEKLAKGARVIIEGFIDDPLVDLVVIDNCKLTERLEWKPPRL